MGKRTQYQVWAEPVSTLPESPRIDKWMGNAPAQLFRKPALIAAILAGSFFWNTTTLPETPHVDAWSSQRPTNLYQRTGLSRANQATGMSFVPVVASTMISFRFISSSSLETFC